MFCTRIVHWILEGVDSLPIQALTGTNMEEAEAKNEKHY
jgi:hypothetical protein